MKKTIKRIFPKLAKFLSAKRKEYIVHKFKKIYPTTKIYENPMPTKYSQENQDMIVFDTFFKNNTPGVFCDIGGNHPLTFNNTRYFEEIGWTGYVFEPLPKMKPLWEEHRKAKLFPFALSDTEGEVFFSVVSDDATFGDMFSHVKGNKKSGYNYKTEEILVQTKILKNVLKENDINYINYMSIDVEGHELNVLKGIDFKSVKIDVLTIENNSICCHIYGDDKIRNIMFENDYLLWGRIIGLDDIFVHKDFLKMINDSN